MHRGVLLSALLLCLLLPLAQPASAQPATDVTIETLRQRINEVLSDSVFTGSRWGIVIQNLRSGETLYTRNPDDNFVPASNVKLFTAAAALDRLGTDFRYRTRLYTDGPVENGVLKGNLIVRGSGDPTLGGHEQQDDVTAVFRAWADSLRARGIRRVEGDIIGDDDVFDDTPLGYGWSWDDATYGYAAEIGGLVFNENKIDLRIDGGSRTGTPGRLSWTPLNTSYVTLVNESETVARWRDEDEDYERIRGTNTINVGSRVVAGGVEKEELTITNPTLFFTHVLREVLLDEDISVAGRPVDVDDLSTRLAYEAAPETYRVLATYTSPPLRTIVQSLNVESLNLYAEQVLRTLGVVNPPDSLDADLSVAGAGAQAVRHTLGAAGADTTFIKVVDGSGLSRQNFVSPANTVKLLAYMWMHPDGNVSSAFYASLPVGGESGTLEYRFQGRSPSNGNVRAKTGTLSNVSALSGYVTSGRGTPIAFSIYANNYITRGSTARRAQDEIVNLLARLNL